MALRRVILSAFLAVASAGVANACPSDLDVEFGDGGIANDANDPIGHGDAALTLPNGDILVAGAVLGDAAVLRYHADGSLDHTFGDQGFSVVSTSRLGTFAALALQDDGRIVAAGSLNGNGIDFLVARFEATGALDTSFGEGGSVVTPIADDLSLAKSIVVLSDGRIVAIGTTFAGQSGAALVCYDQEGNLDSTWGEGGILRVNAPITGTNIGAVQLEDDSVLVGLRLYDEVALAKVLPNGALDPDFGNGGVQFQRTRFYEDAHDIRIDGLGRIYVSGNGARSQWEAEHTLFVRRYLPDGRRDASFGRRGKAKVRFVKRTFAEGLAVLPDGTTAVVATRYRNPDSLIARFTPGGKRDRSFGDAGVLRILSQEIWGVEAQPDQKMLALGYGGVTGDGRILVARYLGGPFDAQCVDTSAN